MARGPIPWCGWTPRRRGLKRLRVPAELTAWSCLVLIEPSVVLILALASRSQLPFEVHVQTEAECKLGVSECIPLPPESVRRVPMDRDLPLATHSRVPEL